MTTVLEQLPGGALAVVIRLRALGDCVPATAALERLGVAA